MRTKKIQEYRKTHTLAQTGKKFNLTSERIRQILLTKNRKRCKVHNRFYYNKCSYCLVKSYRRMLWKLSEKELYKEVEKEALNRKRDYLSSKRRVYLIEILFKGYKKTYTEIALLLKRDRSTIIHLAKQYA